MNDHCTYCIFPSGDSAVTIDFGNTIDELINKKVMALFYQVQHDPLPGIIGVIPAYSSLTLHYDIASLRKMIPADQGVYEWIAGQLEKRLQELSAPVAAPERIIRVPVCYENEYAPDIEALATGRNIPVDEIIRIHSAKAYRVYLLGFLPGFPYMGPVDERIRMPRKSQPVPVAAGSVGIAGHQTGIYSLSSPGGWTIIGRTPLSLFHAGKEEPALLKVGDSVQFYSISSHEFKTY